MVRSGITQIIIFMEKKLENKLTVGYKSFELTQNLSLDTDRPI